MKGDKAMIAKLLKIAKEMPKQVGAALYYEGQIEMTESKRRCPVSPFGRPGVIPGTLRASGTVHDPVIERRKVSVLLSYGGAADAYAVIQHENPDFHHTTGQWKYLESVLNESQPHMAARLAQRLHFNKLKV